MKTLIAILALLAVWLGYYIYQADKVSFLRSNAEAGDPDAQYRLGQLYLGGGVSILQDFEEAAKWYRKAADQGHAEAAKSLDSSYAEALKRCRKAAEQGDAEAQNNLGKCYAEGEVVPQDFVQAVKWYRKAAEQGHAGALFNLGGRYFNGEGVTKDEIEAFAYWHLVSTTDEDARRNLAIIAKKMSAGQIAAGLKRSKELQKELATKKARK